jgi:hypothetical protein
VQPPRRLHAALADRQRTKTVPFRLEKPSLPLKFFTEKTLDKTVCRVSREIAREKSLCRAKQR